MKLFMQVGKRRWVDVGEVCCIAETEDNPPVVQGHLRNRNAVKWVAIEEQYLPAVLKALMGPPKKAETEVPFLSEEEISEIHAAGSEECTICAAKPGTPSLCRSCLVNRNTIMYLKGLLTQQIEKATPKE